MDIPTKDQANKSPSGQSQQRRLAIRHFTLNRPVTAARGVPPGSRQPRAKRAAQVINFFGSSRFTGEGRLDLQKEIGRWRGLELVD
jgi:hypothetical protein